MKPVPPKHALTKVVVVDDSKQFQQSLTRLLSTVSGVAIVGYAEDVVGARKVIDAMNPDIVVPDVQLQAGDHGIDVLRHVVREHPTTKVVALSNLTWQVLKRTYLQSGADAYSCKSLEFNQAREWIAACGRHAALAGKADQRDKKIDVT
jgi:DNA-binding NarL/FixJ family response regulator